MKLFPIFAPAPLILGLVILAETPNSAVALTENQCYSNHDSCINACNTRIPDAPGNRGAYNNCTSGCMRNLNSCITASRTGGSKSNAGGGGTGGTTTKGKVGVVPPASAGALQGPSGGSKTLTPTTNPALSSPNLLGGSGGAASTTTTGNKAKLPTSGGTTAK
jgi:hypothetical protein